MIVLSPCGLWASPRGGALAAAADPSSLVNQVIRKSVRLGEGICGQKRYGLICSRLKETSKTAQTEALMSYFLNFKQVTRYNIVHEYAIC